METGYFGIPGNNGSRSTKVHLVENDKPVCGATLSKQQVYQWCAPYIQTDYLECGHCIKIARKLLMEEMKKKGVSIDKFGFTVLISKHDEERDRPKHRRNRKRLLR
jgi:hypothetical protein